jgi:hypothetical protein
MFARWGRLTYIHRRPMLAAFLLFLAESHPEAPASMRGGL